PHAAMMQLSAACRRRYGFDMDWATGRACDIDKNSRKFLAAQFPNRCIFSNILDFAKNPAAAMNKMKLVQLANCETHGKCVRAPPGDERTEVGVEGPPCVLFSSMGKQEGMATKNKQKKEVHDVWLKDKLDRKPAW
ncbi:Uncharacterized protein SCF082_LOCUS29312, partial [Durusdinium trenchii]